jgi:hydroxymethylbilane synthase
LDNGSDYDAIILAYAGVHRLGWDTRISHIMENEEMLHAVGQGALGLECRQGDHLVLDLLSKVNHRETELQCRAERAFMRSLEGGCSVPLGVFSEFVRGTLTLRGSVTSIDGSEELVHESSLFVGDDVEKAKELGLKVANVLKEQGADRILAQIKHKK